jgi:hypothetical protein
LENIFPILIKILILATIVKHDPAFFGDGITRGIKSQPILSFAHRRLVQRFLVAFDLALEFRLIYQRDTIRLDPVRSGAQLSD